MDTWDKLKKHLMKRFLPRDYEQENYLKLQSLSQEGLSVTEYIKEFEKMTILCDLEEKEELKVARFIRGLNPTIATRVEIQIYDGFDEVTRLALKFEKHDKAKKSYSYSKSNYSGSNSYSKPSITKPKETVKEESKEKGKGPAVTSASRGSDMRRCFKCQGYGHIANECPQKKTLTTQDLSSMIPEFVLPEDDSNPSENEEEEEEGVIYDVEPVSEEECLVIRNLHVEAKSEDEEQREQIFHTRCKVHSKICNLIIDSGSCTNVVSKELVDELKLNTKDLVKPYKLHWLNGGNGIQVRKQALISLCLGPYVDDIWCDVIPMNACHILLGRPWQFDRKVEHDGRTNVYSVTKGKSTFNLKPLSPSKFKKPKSKKGSMFMEAREFEDAMARGDQTYVLMVREVDSVEGKVSREVEGLLKEFCDVFPEDLPAGLPPIRGIEHQIDLIPGAQLPNKPAYRCNPAEAKELQRQVQELIDRGYIQESSSPCAVPALLVPKKEGTWRMCIDSRAVNNITIKYRFPMPRLDDMLDELSGSQVFSKLDLRSGYHQMRGLVSRTTKDWDVKLAHAEFAYNRTPSMTTGRSPFEIVYGVNPYLPIDLVPIPKKDLLNFEATERQAAFLRICEQVKAQIEKANARYKEKANKHRKQPVFKVGDLVWLHLRKERFPSKRKNKLMPRADGPFKVLECYGSSAYKVELPNEYGGVSATFNVGDLSPYLEDDNLRANSSKEGEYDAGALEDNENEVLISRNITNISEGFKIGGSRMVNMITWKDDGDEP